MDEIQNILVTGSRHWKDSDTIRSAIEVVAREFKNLYIVHGGADGADQIADEERLVLGIPGRGYAVDHSIDGPWPGAGPKRNARMLRDIGPVLVLAFWDGRRERCGTLDMVERAIKAGVPVRVYPEDKTGE